MFGREKLQGLESKITELKGKLEKALKERDGLKEELNKIQQVKNDLTESLDKAVAEKVGLSEKLEKLETENEGLREDLDNALEQVSALKAQWEASDLEQARKQMEATKAEYEGLRDLYTGKVQEFNATQEGKEQEFARQAALERHNLENEIQSNRAANQEYVSSTVKAFGESYNYYLNQIKMLMDALGDVASRTGEALFSESSEDLKTRIGQQMAEKIKAETDPLRGDTDNLILIGSAEITEAEPAEEAVEPAETAQDAEEEAIAEAIPEEFLDEQEKLEDVEDESAALDTEYGEADENYDAEDLEELKKCDEPAEGCEPMSSEE